MATGNLSSLATRYSTITGELPKTGIVMTCNIYYIATALSLTPKLGRNRRSSLAGIPLINYWWSSCFILYFFTYSLASLP